MSSLKYYVVYIDGIDKSGKDTIAPYVIKLSNYRYIVNCRGILTQVALAKLYDRQDEYEVINQKNIINVLIHVDKDDWEIRCKLTNEPTIDYEKNVAAFEYAKDVLKNKTIIFEYNSSKQAPYEIAKDIVNKIKFLEETI